MEYTMENTKKVNLRLPAEFLNWSNEKIGSVIRGYFDFSENQRKHGFMSMCKPVAVDGVTYPSKAEAIRVLGISRLKLKGKEV
jgi:hypothetical protein